MNFRKWIDRYSTDCKLKYNSEATQSNYCSCVKLFLEKFDNYSEPKEIPTQEIKEYLLTFKTINTRRANLCAIKSFYEITVGMPNKIDSIQLAAEFVNGNRGNIHKCLKNKYNRKTAYGYTWSYIV